MKPKFLYRVDGKALKITRLPIENFDDTRPVNQQCCDVFGTGYYFYKESEQEAKELMVKIIESMIYKLTEQKDNLK